ncbi:unnamed protein product, partial [Mesorhabditis spiculigera]
MSKGVVDRFEIVEVENPDENLLVRRPRIDRFLERHTERTTVQATRITPDSRTRGLPERDHQRRLPSTCTGTTVSRKGALDSSLSIIWAAAARPLRTRRDLESGEELPEGELLQLVHRHTCDLGETCRGVGEPAVGVALPQPVAGTALETVEQQRHSLTLGFRLKLCETTSLERGRQIDRPYGERKHVDAQLNRKYAKVGFGVDDENSEDAEAVNVDPGQAHRSQTGERHGPGAHDSCHRRDQNQVTEDVHGRDNDHFDEQTHVVVARCVLRRSPAKRYPYSNRIREDKKDEGAAQPPERLTSGRDGVGQNHDQTRHVCKIGERRDGRSLVDLTAKQAVAVGLRSRIMPTPIDSDGSSVRHPDTSAGAISGRRSARLAIRTSPGSPPNPYRSNHVCRRPRRAGIRAVGNNAAIASSAATAKATRNALQPGFFVHVHDRIRRGLGDAGVIESGSGCVVDRNGTRGHVGARLLHRCRNRRIVFDSGDRRRRESGNENRSESGQFPGCAEVGGGVLQPARPRCCVVRTEDTVTAPSCEDRHPSPKPTNSMGIITITALAPGSMPPLTRHQNADDHDQQSDSGPRVAGSR